MKFPKQLYVKIESEDTADECLLAYDNPEDVAEIGESVRIGVYQLVREEDVKTRVERTAR